MRILWADDHGDQARTFASSLAGYDVDFAADGEDALARIGERHYDVVLLDLRMPPGEWGGLWLLEQLSEASNPPVALVVSGEGTQEETIRARRLGAFDYIRKSHLEEELIPTIEAAVTNAVDHLLSAPEGERVECKQTLLIDVATGKKEKHIELAALKTVAAFANARGGTLIVGKADDGAVLGIERDFQSLRSKPNQDGWELHLRALIDRSLGALVNQLVSVAFRAQSKEVTIALVHVRAAGEPVFLRSGPEVRLYVRAGNRTASLDVAEAWGYLQPRFGSGSDRR